MSAPKLTAAQRKALISVEETGAMMSASDRTFWKLYYDGLVSFSDEKPGNALKLTSAGRAALRGAK